MTTKKDPVTGEVITDPNNPNYDPSKDPAFMDRATQDTPPTPRRATNVDPLTYPRNPDGTLVRDPSGEVAPVAPYGYYPSGTPRTEPLPDPIDFPNCPQVSPSDYPFDTTTIPSGCNQPLTEECAAYYNAKYAPEAVEDAQKDPALYRDTKD